MSAEGEKSPEGLPTGLISPPSTTDRDLALGGFMDAWSELEAMIRNLLSVLSGAPPETSFSIAAAIPDVGRMQELLLALGEIQLEDPSDKKELEEICTHFLASSRYRNSIVHGQWVLTNNRTPPISAVHPAYAWVRVYVLMDKTKEFMAVVGSDEKTAKRHVFTLQRLDERASSARMLGVRVSAFSESIKGRVRLPKSGP